MSKPRLLLFNLMTDERDPVLGFACDWVRRLAAQSESIDVLTMTRGAASLPANTRVFSAGRERGWSRPARLATFYGHLLRLLATRRYDACFAHMTPLFAALAGPLLSARGVRTVLWYTHRQRSLQLRLGMAMSWRVVSADASSFPYETGKLRVIGHGIDTQFYSPFPHAKSRPGGSVSTRPRDDGGTSTPAPGQGSPFPPGGGRAGDGGALVVQVGRLAAIKHQATTLAAVAGTEAWLALIGAAQDQAGRAYEQQLRDRARELGMEQRWHFSGALPAADLRAWTRQAAIAVNMSPPGLFDKAALESMACAIPTVVSNPAFAPILGEYADLLLTAGPEDVAGLHARLQRLLACSSEERAQIGMRLRQAVQRQHSLNRLIPKLLAVLETGEVPAPNQRESE